MNDRIAGSSQKGGILIGLIITMVIFASLGVAMLSFTTTSTFSNLATYASTGAGYLAESGYRYATGQYKNAGTEEIKNSTLESLHNKTLELLDNQGEFTLGIYPYYFKSTADLSTGNTSLEAAFPGSQPDGFTVPASGTLAIFGAGGYEYYSYANVNESGGNFTFQLSTALVEDLNEETNIVPVCYPSETKVVSNADNTITITNGSEIPIR
jgi:type II secretory pathway pseudopilin PulG